MPENNFNSEQKGVTSGEEAAGEQNAIMSTTHSPHMVLK